MSRDVAKCLVGLLRHRAVGSGVAMREDGYVLVQDAIDYLARRGHGRVTKDVIHHIVRSCKKQRFALSDDGKRIRATQGHSIAGVKDDALLVRIKDASEVPCAVHGTYSKFWPSIAAQGLKRGTRNHIHFATGRVESGGVLSGARSDADVFIYVDVGRAMADGIAFYRADNGVILTKGEGDTGILPTRYFERVEKRNAAGAWEHLDVW